MKINGLNVREHGTGFQVDLSFYVGREEAVGIVLTDLLTDMESDLHEVWKAVGTRETTEEVYQHADNVEPGEPEPEPEKPTRRRRRKSAKAEAPEGGGEEDKRPTRRRRGGRQASAPAADGTSSRRRSRSSASKPQESASSSEVPKDGDILKACSQAAQRVGTAEVMELLGQFGCSKAGELADDQKAEFFEAVQELK